MTGRRPWLLGFLFIGGVLTALYSARGHLLPLAAEWLDVGSELDAPVDYAMVLAGDENTRPFVAAALVNRGLARKALISTTISSPEEDDRIAPPTDEIIRRVLLCRGVSEGDIVILNRRIVNTYHEAQALDDFLRSSPNARVAVVTSDYHTRRARSIFSRVLKERADQVTFVSSPTDDFHAGNWWQGERGFATIVGEYLRLVFYAIRYHPLRHWGIAGIGVVVVALLHRWLCLVGAGAAPGGLTSPPEAPLDPRRRRARFRLLPRSVGQRLPI